MTPEQTRFLRFVTVEDGCWRWTGATRSGYAAFWLGGRVVRGHRFAFEQFRGPIAEGLVLDHLCRTLNCVNPWHLEEVTQKENLHRSPVFWATRQRQREGVA